jgi:hypothetical protein
MSPLGSTRIVSLQLTEHQILSAALSSAAAGWEMYPIYSETTRVYALVRSGSGGEIHVSIPRRPTDLMTCRQIWSAPWRCSPTGRAETSTF